MCDFNHKIPMDKFFNVCYKNENPQNVGQDISSPRNQCFIGFLARLISNNQFDSTNNILCMTHYVKKI